MSIESNIPSDSRPNKETERGLIEQLVKAQAAYDIMDEFDQFTWGDFKADQLNAHLERSLVHVSMKASAVSIQLSDNGKIYHYRRPDGDPVTVKGYAAQVTMVSTSKITETSGLAVVLGQTEPIFDDVLPHEMPDYVVIVPIKNLIEHEYLPNHVS